MPKPLKAETATAEGANGDRTDGVQIFLLFAFFFFVIAAFWTLKPLRTSSAVKEFGIELYPLLKQGIVIVVPLIVSLYSLLANKLSRKQLVYSLTGYFLAANLVFWYLLTFRPSAGVQLAFFFHVDTYVTVMVTVFWTYLNDIYQEVGARKVYGLIGTGGLAGGVLGALVSGWASELLGSHIVLVSALFMAPVLGAVFLLERGRVPTATGPAVSPSDRVAAGARQDRLGLITEGMTSVLRSKYLLAIVVIVGAYEVISTIVDFQFAGAAAAAYESRDAMAAYQGKVFFAGQIASIGVQIALTTLVHRKYGAAAGLLFLPLALLLGTTAILAVPVLGVIAFTIGSEAAFGYSINQSSKEILYVPLDPVARFKGKAFIDMFVLRAAKTLGAGLLLGYVFWLEPLGAGSWFLSLIVVGAIAGWLVAVRYVSRVVKQRSGADADEVEAAPQWQPVGLRAEGAGAARIDVPVVARSRHVLDIPSPRSAARPAGPGRIAGPAQGTVLALRRAWGAVGRGPAPAAQHRLADVLEGGS